MLRCLAVALFGLAGCQPVPVVSSSTPVAVNTFPAPACLIFCTVHISAIREDVQSVGSGSVATGAKSATQSSSTERGQP